MSLSMQLWGQHLASVSCKMTLQCSKETAFEPVDLQAQIMLLSGLNNNVVSCAGRLLRSCVWLITGVTFKHMPVWSTVWLRVGTQVLILLDACQS